MAHFLFLTWNGAGNQPPAVALAQALIRRGHAATVAGYESQRAHFQQHGLRFVLLPRAAAVWRDAAPEEMFAIKLSSAWAAEAHLVDLPELMTHQCYDALVIDCLMFGALAAAEQISVPTVALIHSAPGALMPPGGVFERHILSTVNSLRIRAGLLPVVSLWESWSRFPAFANSIPLLDPLAVEAPAAFTYFGPFMNLAGRSCWQSPWPATDRRPLILVSFSTGPYWDQTSRILRTLRALADVNCRVLVTAGSEQIPLDAIPANATVVRHVPHDEVLPGAGLTITHAGHGTVTASLRHGVPLLCLPNPAADQPILAAQVQAIGAGIALDGEKATSDDIRTAAQQLLTDPSWKINVRAVANEFAAAPGVEQAATRLVAIAGRADSS